MVRSPIHFIEVGGKTLDEMGLSDLVQSISVDSAVDKMDAARIRLTYGNKLDSAYDLLTHGQAVKISLGYVSEVIFPVFHGFISGVQISASARSVDINLASYFKQMDQDEHKRSFTGQTVSQIISSIVSNYDNIEVGEIDNGDFVITDSYQQDGTDLQALSMVAKKTGMHLRLEPSLVTGSKVLLLSLLSLGRETKPVQFDDIVYNPEEDQQNPITHWHLKEFDPESSILGAKVSVQVESVNPRYNHSTSYEVTPGFEVGVDISIPFATTSSLSPPSLPPLDFPEGSLFPDDLYVAPTQLSVQLPNWPTGLTRLGVSESNSPYEDSADSWQIQTGTGTLDLSLGLSADDIVTSSSTSSYAGTDVVFTCFGQTSVVHFSENVTSEAAQRRIAEAIQNDSSFSFVVGKSCVLADGESTLQVGQRRNIILNDFPLFGSAFSGVYVITAVQHMYSRSSGGFTTTFSCAKNSLEIPPEVRPAVRVGAQPADVCVDGSVPFVYAGTPGLGAYPITNGWFIHNCGEWYYEEDSPYDRRTGTSPQSRYRPPENLPDSIPWEPLPGIQWGIGQESEFSSPSGGANPLLLFPSNPAPYASSAYQGEFIGQERELSGSIPHAINWGN